MATLQVKTQVKSVAQQEKKKTIESYSKPTIKSPFSMPIWPKDEIPQNLFDDLSKLKSSLVHGVNSVTKTMEKDPNVRFVLFADADHDSVPKMMTEHIKILCVMKNIPFLNLKCSTNQLGTCVNVKTSVLAVTGTTSDQHVEKFVKKYQVSGRKVTIPWFQSETYQPLQLGKMDKKRKENPNRIKEKNKK